MPGDPRAAAVRRLARVAQDALAGLGFEAKGAVLNRVVAAEYVQVLQIVPSKYVYQRWAAVQMGAYSLEVATTLNWPTAPDPVELADCQVRGAIRRRNASDRWPLDRADDELREQTAKQGVRFYRLTESPAKTVEASITGELQRFAVNPAAMVVLADMAGKRGLAEQLARDEWKSSRGHPSEEAVDRLIRRLGMEPPQEPLDQ
jgi:hypothetical protein